MPSSRAGSPVTRRPSEKQAVAASPKPARGPVALLIGTRKGAFFLRSDGARRTWKLTEPMFLGHAPATLVPLSSDPRISARPGKKLRPHRPFQKCQKARKASWWTMSSG